MENNLTPQQRMAVENRGGKLLVSAAAGSGKTKVLVDRLLTDIMDPVAPCNIDDFLIITYTKAAAAELRGKIAAKLSERLAEQPENRHLQRQMQRIYLAKISTVHSFCTDLLREYAYELDLPGDFRVADENECRQLRELAMEETLENAYANGLNNPDFRAFVDTQGLGRTDRLVPEIVQKVYDASRCHLDPEKWLDHCVSSADMSRVEDAAQTVWGDYLVRDLKGYLAMQIAAMERAVELARAEEGFEKVEALLEQALKFLRHLEAAQTWDEIVDRRKIHYGTMRFPKKTDEDIKTRIKAIRDGCKEGLEKKLKIFCDKSDQVLSALGQTSAAVRGLIALTRDYGERYQNLKRRRRVLDFSDLEQRTLDLLVGKRRTSPTRIAREVGKRFREVLVDEYQDSNAVQDAIFSTLTVENQNCFMVGDVKQSIYQFRLADPGIFLEKYHDYAEAEKAEPGEGRKVLLSANFRSGGAVLDACNDVFYRCMSEGVGGLDYGEEEALREGIPHESLGEAEVELHVLTTSEDSYGKEAAYVADRILALLDGTHLIRGKEGLRPIQPEDIVILLRSPGSVGQVYQDALSERGIRSSFGSGRDLLQTAEIGLLRSLLQIISNPRQDIPLLAVLASPMFGFTADDLAAIRSRQKKGPVYDALWESDLPRAKAFVELLTELRKEARSASLTQLLESCLRRTRMDSIYGAMPGGGARKANLQTFYRLAAEYEMGGSRDLVQFLEHLESLEERGLTGGAASASGAVTIMSIHKSKGLEFPVVFLAGLSKRFNKENLTARILCDKELGIGLSVADPHTRIRYPSAARRAIAAKMEEQGISEEMRVLYVAMTRARDLLIMTYADKNPEAVLENIALRLDFDRGELLTREAANPGTWVLIAAMQRMEAGALHAIGGRPGALTHSEYPWKICLADAAGEEVGAAGEALTTQPMPEGAEEKLRRALGFVYPHTAATQAPSKLTATDLKGRFKDAEAAEDTREQHRRTGTLRRPAFLGETRDQTAFGNAMHRALQYIRYEDCGSEGAIREEVARMVERGLLTPEQGELVDCGKLARFFETEIGRKLMKGVSHVREFKFSILEDAGLYAPELAGEQVLLQGVADCAILEPEGITVLDFKTDYVTEDTVGEVLRKYRPQVEFYARALSRIFEKPVKGRYLYLVRLNRFVEV